MVNHSEGVKPVLVLLHGALGSSVQLNELKRLADERFEVHLLDFSGHGGNSVPENGFTLELFRNDILHYLSLKNISGAHFFGYSMGGYVALSLAAAHPEKVKSVFTLATKFNWTPETAAREASFLVPQIMEQKIPKFTARLEQLHQPEDWRKVAHATAQFMIRLGEQPLNNSEFSSIKCRVKCVVGDQDKMVSSEETEKVIVMIPYGSMTVLADTPHPLENCNPELLYKALLDFI